MATFVKSGRRKCYCDALDVTHKSIDFSQSPLFLKVLLTNRRTENTLNSHSFVCLNYLTIISLTVSAVVAGIRPTNGQFTTVSLIRHIFSMQCFFQYLLIVFSFFAVILSDVNQDKSGAGLLFLFVINHYYYYNYYYLCFFMVL